MLYRWIAWSRRGTEPAWLNRVRIGCERLVASSDDASMARIQRVGLYLYCLALLLICPAFLSNPDPIPDLPPREAWRSLNPPLYFTQPIGSLSCVLSAFIASLLPADLPTRGLPPALAN